MPSLERGSGQRRDVPDQALESSRREGWKENTGGHGPEAPSLDAAALAKEIPQGFFPRFILCHSFIQLIFELHAVKKQRWRKSWNSPSFIEKTYPSNPRCSHWATHRLPWDKMGPWGDCKAHHSNGWMWMSMAGVLWNTVGSWFRQGTYPSSTRRLLRKKTRVQEARSVLASFFPRLTDQAGRMYVLPAAWDSQPWDSGALRPCPATLRVRGPMTHGPAHLGMTLRSRSQGGRIQKGTCQWVWRPGKLSSYVTAPLAYLVPSGELETGAPSSRKTPLSISWTSALTSLLPSLLQSLWEDTNCPCRTAPPRRQFRPVCCT